MSKTKFQREIHAEPGDEGEIYTARRLIESYDFTARLPVDVISVFEFSFALSDIEHKGLSDLIKKVTPKNAVSRLWVSHRSVSVELPCGGTFNVPIDGIAADKYIEQKASRKRNRVKRNNLKKGE